MDESACERPKEVRDGRGCLDSEGSREMGTVTQYFTNHPAARIAWPDLDKGTNSRVVCGLDHTRKVDSIQSLRLDGIRGCFLVWKVGASPSAAVEGDSLWRACFEQVQLTVGRAKPSSQFAMDGAHTSEREPAATQMFDEGLDDPSIASYNTLIWGVDN